MGMGTCQYQKECKLFSPEERPFTDKKGCEHYYYSTYEEWCKCVGDELPTENQRSGKELIP